ncbi:MAG: dTDP-4-dehydrorhamnose 3,5-epimerase [Thermoplasmatota archaeon]
MPFDFAPLPEFPEIIRVTPRAFGDDRGWFMETYKRSDFAKHISYDFVQDNHSRSLGRGVLRGLHCQNDPTSQGKLVRVVEGEIFDVAVDVRRGSPTYCKWVSARLSAADRAMLWIPPGFLHGFQSLSETTEVIYKVTAEYDKATDRAIRWSDPTIGVVWPIAVPILSAKDATAPLLKDSDLNFRWKGST